jgi:hypothetical protein
VFVDEAGLNLSMSRLFARAQAGERAIGSIPRNNGGNISLLGALSLDGLIASMTIPGSTNTEVFLNVSQVLVPQLWQEQLSLWTISQFIMPSVCEWRLSRLVQNQVLTA